MPAPLGHKYGFGTPNTGRPAEWTKEIIEEEARLFREWADLETSLVWREFAPLRGYTSTYLYRWIDKKGPYFNEMFCDAADYARDVIGSRREKLALEKMIPRTAPLYDDELHKYEEAVKDRDAERKRKVESENEANALANLRKAIADTK